MYQEFVSTEPRLICNPGRNSCCVPLASHRFRELFKPNSILTGPLKPFVFEMDGSSYRELTKPEDVSNNETAKAEETWTKADWIRALDEAKSVFERLKNVSETMFPVNTDSSEADPSKADSSQEDFTEADSSKADSSKADSSKADFSEAEEDVKVQQPSTDFVAPPVQALDETINEGCTCRIDSAVEKELSKAMKVGDCVTLLRLLKTTPCLLDFSPSPYNYISTYHGATQGPKVQPSDTPSTVLQWAAKRRCLKLLVYILSFFLDDNGEVVKEFVHGYATVDRDEYFEKQNETGFTAADLLWSVRDYSIYAYFANFAKHRKSNLTLKEMQLELLDPMFVSPDSASSLTSTAMLDENDSMRAIVLKATKKHKMLLDDRLLLSDCNYNFVAEYDELLFHFACAHLISNGCEEYVRAVIREVAREGPEAVTYLFNYRNAQGQAPLHCASNDLQNRRMFLELLKVEFGSGEECGDYWNSRDVAGWTVLHIAASKGDERAVKSLLKDKSVDVNAEVKNRDGKGATALQLAIVHDRLEVIRCLIEHGAADVNAMLWGHFSFKGIKKFELQQFTPLYLAATMGKSDIVKALIDHPKVEDGILYDGDKISAVHIAAIKGDPKILRYLTNNPKFDISVTFKGCTALHFVVDGSHFGQDLDTKALKEYCHDESAFGLFENVNHDIDTDRGACISMLIQGGLDVWKKNDEGHFPEPGPSASSDVRHFWYQKLLSETQDAKSNLSVAGNAISVVSALVATASYVGPLQPPLGLDSNSVQDGSLPIRVYMVTITLSFYMAIASIIFAVVPSLPMPQEGLYEEWQRSQKSIIYAIHLLLLAVMTFLISFGAASNVVESPEYSWQHQGLVFYPTLLGGFICVMAISLFYLRLFRLAFVKNATIKHIYQFVFRVNKKEEVKVKVTNGSEDIY